LEVVGVTSNVYSFQRENNARMLEVMLYDTHDVLAEGNIDLRKQTYSDVEYLRTFVHGVPFTIVNSKSGKAYVVYLAFGASVKRANVVNAHVVQDAQNGNQDARSPSNEVNELKKLLEREYELRILQQIENDHMRKLDADVIALQTQLLQVRSNKKLENGPGVLSTSSQAPSSGLELGTHVMVHSLHAKPEYNGQLGKVIVLLEGDRAGVSLDTDPEPMHSFHISKLLAIQHLAQEQVDGRQEISRSPPPIVQPAASLSLRTTASLHSREGLDQVLNSIDRKPQIWNHDLNFPEGQEGVHLPSDRSPQGAQVVPLHIHRQAQADNAKNVPAGGNSLLAPVQIESMGGRPGCAAVGEETCFLNSSFRHSAVQTRSSVDSAVHTHPSDAVPNLQIGTQVRVQSMNAATEYNGKIGTVIQLLETGRVGVLLKDDPESMVIFKSSKLEVIPFIGVKISAQSCKQGHSVHSHGVSKGSVLTPISRPLHATTSPSLSPPPVRGPGNREGGAADLTAPLAVVPKAGSKVDPSSHAKAPEVTMQVYVRVFGISDFKSTTGWMDKTGFNVVVVVLSYVQVSCRSEHHIMYVVYDTRLVLRFCMCDRSFRQARSWQRST
jgi:hypothetical protein